MSLNPQSDVIKVGSRKSELALIQTNYVIDCLKKFYPSTDFQIITMSTKGDEILDKALPKIGEKSLFTKELEDALENEQVHFLVHSLKDMPTTLRGGMVIGAILKREDPRDAVVMSKRFKDFKTLQELPSGSIVGTSSLRRCAFLSRTVPHLKVETIRGNLNTRLKKLDDENGPYAAIILAVSGLKRMGKADRITEILDSKNILYAVGQGALGVECRESDEKILSLLQVLSHSKTTLRCLCERSFLKTLGGGCSAPVAVATELDQNKLILSGAVLSLDGKELLNDILHTKLCLPDNTEPFKKFPRKCPYRISRNYTGIIAGVIDDFNLLTAEKLGEDMAQSLIKKNALEIMAKAKNEVLNL